MHSRAGTASPKSTESTLKISDIWINPTPSGLLAKISMTIPAWSQTTLHDCSVVRTRTGGYFVLPPQAPMVGRDGQVLRDPDGKPRYKPAVIFTKEAGKRFSEAVVRSSRQSHPEIFAGRPA
jgi:hypothetical protein